MLSENVQMIDVHPIQWKRLMEIHEPPRGAGPRRSILLLITRGDRVLKAYHSQRGTLRHFTTPLLTNLGALASREGVDVVWAVEREAFGALLTRADARWSPEQGYLETLLSLAQGLTEFHGKTIRRHPPLSPLPVPAEKLGQALEWAIPDDRTYLLYVFDSPCSIWTSLIMRKRSGEFDLFTSHETLASDGFQLVSWREDLDRIIQGIEEKWGSPFVGLFMEREVLDRIRGSSRPLATLLQAARDDEVVVKPYPMRLRMLLSILRWVV